MISLLYTRQIITTFGDGWEIIKLIWIARMYLYTINERKLKITKDLYF